MTKLYVCEISNLIEEIKKDENAINSYFDKLGKVRIEYILKHNKAEDRARTLGASLLLLFALQYEGYEMDGLPDFGYDEKGKPILKEIRGHYFNLSHTKNIITCVISKKEVGVDVEHMREIKEVTINKVFSKDEQEMAKYSKEGYVRLWTMKEACAKLRGIGITDILDGIHITQEDGIYVEKLNQDIKNTFRYIIVTEGMVYDFYNNPYHYSVCANEKTDITVVHMKWDKQQIISR